MEKRETASVRSGATGRRIGETDDQENRDLKDLDFQGFSRPESNFFRMPNNWTDITAEINSLAELKVVEYIMRHTWGFQEFGVSRRITINEFINGRKKLDGSRIDSGTKLSEQSVRNGLKLAIEDGYIIEEIDARDRARIKKYYRLRMSGDSEKTGHLIESTGSTESIRPAGMTRKAAKKPDGVKELDLGAKIQDFDPQNHDLSEHELDPGLHELDPRGRKFIPRSEKDKSKKPNQKNFTKQQLPAGEAQEVYDLLVHFGITEPVAWELSLSTGKDLVEEWVSYTEQAENIKNPAAFLVGMIRSGTKPVRSRPTVRSQKTGIDFARYTQPGGKYYNLLKGSPLEMYLEDEDYQEQI